MDVAVPVTEPQSRGGRRRGGDWEFHGWDASIISPDRAASRFAADITPPLPPKYQEIRQGQPYEESWPRLAGPGHRRFRSKLGGFADFCHRELVAACFQCGTQLEFHAQLTESTVPILGDWLAYVFICPKQCEARVAVQS
jgi:hypothetical protein